MVFATAKDAIDAMKGTPVLLGALLLNVLVLVGFAWTLHEIAGVQERRDGILKACIERGT
jgi:hypothetical protein